MAYPGYPAQPGPGGVDPLWGYFSAIAGQDGQIDANELQRCLSSAGQQYSKETCRIMITMLDRDYSGKMGFSEFKELYQVIGQWQQTFWNFDRDRSGTVEPNELQQALNAFGYRLSPQAFQILVARYGVNGKIGFDDFISCCIKLRILTDQFRRRDVSQTGNATFQYDDFIQVSMRL